MSSREVVLVEDDKDLRAACAQAVELDGLAVTTALCAEDAFPLLTASFAGVVVSDIRLPGASGLELLSYVRAIDTDIPVLLVTGHGDIAMAVDAMRDGAYDFMEKPFAPSRLVEAVRRGIEKRSLVLENRGYRALLADSAGMEAKLIGVSPVAHALRKQVSAIAATDADVLVYGETGTGKEVVARCLHDFGSRADQPFVAINCGALPATVVESELFGHAKGAFTGAIQRRIGKFQAADGGTIFLDEIESMPLDTQVKILRVLQERVIEPLGENRAIPINVRVIAASKADLREAATAGTFREDLLYRLDVVQISLPPLRERPDDIPVLFEHFLQDFACKRGLGVPAFDPAMCVALVRETWPGNVRELRNRAERHAYGIGDLAMATVERATGLNQTLDAVERVEILRALSAAGGNVTKAHEALQIGRKTLYDKMKKHEIDPKYPS